MIALRGWIPFFFFPSCSQLMRDLGQPTWLNLPLSVAPPLEATHAKFKGGGRGSGHLDVSRGTAPPVAFIVKLYRK